MGGTRVARRAGISVAARATAPRKPMARANVWAARSRRGICPTQARAGSTVVLVVGAVEEVVEADGARAEHVVVRLGLLVRSGKRCIDGTVALR